MEMAHPLDLHDTVFLSALAVKLGHEAPFTAEELASIESLTVTHARNLESLADCTGLRHLRVIASEVDDFLFCQALNELAHLEVQCSIVRSLIGLAYCSKLERVDLLFTSVTEGRHLFGAPAWRRGTLVGNPWSQLSMDTLHEAASWPGMLIEFSTGQDWKRTCQLWEKAEACSGILAGLDLVVRPGLPKLTSNTYDALQAGVTLRSALRSPTFRFEALFRDRHDLIDAPDLTLLAHVHELGFHTDAVRWIAESTLSADDQIALTTFVKHFPSVIFYRTSAEAIETLVREGELPAWYTAALAALNGWMPVHRRPPVRFAAFDLAFSPRASRAATLTYHLGHRDHGNDETGEALRTAGFVALGLSMEDPELFLAFRDNGDPTIYEYHEEDVRDSVSEGRDVASSIYPAFRSYASMLGSIVSLHPPDLDPILAQ
jgi:hypothetical protein